MISNFINNFDYREYSLSSNEELHIQGKGILFKFRTASSNRGRLLISLDNKSLRRMEMPPDSSEIVIMPFSESIDIFEERGESTDLYFVIESMTNYRNY